MSEVKNKHCQTHIFWSTYEDRIPKNDIVRVVKKITKSHENEIKKVIPIKKMGRKRHNPVNMLAMLIYAHMDNTWDATKIYERTQYDDRYRYLLDGEMPSYTSIKDYRSKLEEILQDIHKGILLIAYNEGYTKYEHLSNDGSPIVSYNSKDNMIN